MIIVGETVPFKYSIYNLIKYEYKEVLNMIIDHRKIVL